MRTSTIFSSDALATRARQQFEAYTRARREVRDSVAERDTTVVDAAAKNHSTHIHWDDKLKRSLRGSDRISLSLEHIRTVQYRPFVKEHCYADPFFTQRPAFDGRDLSAEPPKPCHLRHGCWFQEAVLGHDR